MKKLSLFQVILLIFLTTNLLAIDFNLGKKALDKIKKPNKNEGTSTVKDVTGPKIVFSKSLFTQGEKSATSKKFNENDFIYGYFKLENTLKNKLDKYYDANDNFWSNNPVIFEVLIQRSSQIIGKKGKSILGGIYKFSFKIDDPMTSKKELTIGIHVPPQDTRKSDIYANRKFSAFMLDQVQNEYSGPIEVECFVKPKYGSKMRLVKGKFAFSSKASKKTIAAYKKIIAAAESDDSRRYTMPKAGMKNKKLEKQIAKIAKKDILNNKKVLRVVIKSRGWDMVKNKLGRIIARRITAAIAYKDSRKCKVGTWNFHEDKIGKKWGKLYFGSTEMTPIYEIHCDNVMK